MSGESGEVPQSKPKTVNKDGAVHEVNRNPLKRLFGRKSKVNQQDKPTPTQDLALPSQENIETPITPLYAPVEDDGYTDANGKVIREKREPTEEELRAFFTSENIQRLVYCPQINIDLTDSWGMFGYEPGYIFINEREYEGIRNLNDEQMFAGKRTDTITTKSGHEILTAPHYDFFPQNKFSKQLLTPSRTPKTFTFLRKLLDRVNPEDLSTFPTEDLDMLLKSVKEGSFPDERLLKYAERHRLFAKKAIEGGEEKRGQTLLEWADINEKSYREHQEQIPKNVKRYLEILEEASKRSEVKNTEFLKLSTSPSKQEEVIENAIQQAREKGDLDLVQQIEALHAKTSLYTNNRLFLPEQKDTKSIE